MVNFDDWWLTQCKLGDTSKRWCGTSRSTCLTIFNSIEAFKLAESKRKEQRDAADPVFSQVFEGPVTFEQILTRINDVTRARLKQAPTLTVVRGGKHEKGESK